MSRGLIAAGIHAASVGAGQPAAAAAASSLAALLASQLRRDEVERQTVGVGGRGPNSVAAESRDGERPAGRIQR
jgi:hypothetical protein